MSYKADRPSKSEQDIVQTLAAGATLRVPRLGRAYQCISVTTDGKVQVGLSQSAQGLGRFLRQGMGEVLGPGEDDFDFIEFYNNDTNPQTFTLQTSFGTLVDSRFNVVGGTVPVAVIGNVKVDDQGADGTTDYADSVIASTGNLVVAANANRKAMLVYNNDPAISLRWGAAPDATHGMPIPPQSMQSIPLTATFKIYNPGGAGVTVSLQELTHT